MIPQLRPRELESWVQTQSAAAAPGKPILLDVREPWEWGTASTRHPDFELLQIPMGEIPRRIEEIAVDQPIACLCHHGARSQRVATFLAAQGHRSVVNVAGGIEAWSNELDPSVPRY